MALWMNRHALQQWTSQNALTLSPVFKDVLQIMIKYNKQRLGMTVNYLGNHTALYSVILYPGEGGGILPISASVGISVVLTPLGGFNSPPPPPPSFYAGFVLSNPYYSTQLDLFFPTHFYGIQIWTCALFCQILVFSTPYFCRLLLFLTPLMIIFSIFMGPIISLPPSTSTYIWIPPPPPPPTGCCTVSTNQW